MLKNWKFWIGLLVSIVFLVWALWGLDLNGFMNEVASGNYWWLIPSVLTYFVAVWVRTWRWDYMLRPLKHIPVRDLFPVVVIGYMGNNIYPLRMGELLRSYVLWRREDVPVGASLGTVVVERVFDGVIMLIFVFVGLPFLPFPGDYQFLVTVASIAFLGALIVFFVLAAMPDRALALAKLVFGMVLPAKASEPLLDFTEKFLDGLKGLRDFKMS